MFKKIRGLILNAGNNFINFVSNLFKSAKENENVENSSASSNYKEKEPEEINVTKELSASELMKCISDQKIPESIIDLANEVVDERNGSATLEVNKDISLILVRNEQNGIDIYDSDSLTKPFAELTSSGGLNIKDCNIANKLFDQFGFGLLSDLKHVEVSNGPDLNAMLNGQGQER